MNEQAALEALLGPGVRFATRAVGAVDAGALFPEEAEGVARAVDARRLEHAAGRAAARAALRELGLTPGAIRKGAGGAPEWPAGVVGSITHTREWALAVVARGADVGGLGVDAEPDAPIEPSLWPSISTEAERATLDPIAARRLFCAKEAAYKCQYPRSGTLLEFQDLELSWRGDAFEARFTRAVRPFACGDVVSGRIARVGARWVAAARL